MLRCSKAVVLLFATVLCGIVGSSAGGAEWHTNGHGHWATTSAGTYRLKVIPVPPFIIVVIECQTPTTNTVTFGSSTFAGSTAPGLGNVTPSFGSCTVSGSAGFTLRCNTASFNAITYAGGTTIGTAGSGITTGTISNMDCRLSAGATTCTTITGFVPTDYINPNPIATGSGRLTVTGQLASMTASKIGAGCAAVPHGTVTVGTPDAGSGVLPIGFNVDGPNAPYIYRTP
jgi:hypothetical protein